ncbi:hypothetical protein DUI87_26865 [Hirundo rustica rustica]|uniref:Uncharacterized protein n=1 Tax=Hirundo rustica rustica TaxID=333673 RepID=A0A3M0J7E1_HIRRU|nr:hypothetical protein DUI87_26865 [Hirundo rustica rustica]
MLVQVVALLGLGVLGSSAQLQEERSRNLVGLIIRELLQDMKKLNLNAVPSLVTVNATVERCMHSHLKTFASTLTALDTHSKFIAKKLTRLNAYKNILPKSNTMEAGGNAATYLEGFIEALKNSKESVEQRLIVLNLRKIQSYGESCTGWMPLLSLTMSYLNHLITFGKYYIRVQVSLMKKQTFPAHEEEKLQLPPETADLHSIVIQINYAREKFLTPLDVKRLSCAHNNTELFIRGLEKIDKRTCMRKVAKDMEKLEKICDILKKSSSHDESCWNAETRFSKFKENLQEFLRWVNGKVDCSSVGRSEMTLYLDGKCSCRDLWKSLQGLG